MRAQVFNPDVRPLVRFGGRLRKGLQFRPPGSNLVKLLEHVGFCDPALARVRDDLLLLCTQAIQLALRPETSAVFLVSLLLGSK